MAAGALTGNTDLAVLGPLGAAGAVACARFPTPAVLALFVITGLAGTLAAFTSVPTRGAIDIVLFGLWLGVLAQFVTQRERPVWLWPGVLAPALYLGLTALEIFTAETVSQGFDAFRLGAWSMMAFLALALVPWPQARFVRIARWLVVIVALVGLYNIYRYVVGPAPEEQAVAKATHAGAKDLRFFGSFPTAQRLAGWFSMMLPVMLILGLTLRGPYRIAAAAAAGMCGFAVVTSNVLTGTFAAIAAVGATILLYVLARAFASGQRLALGMLASVGALVIAGTGYFVAISGSERSEQKYSYILDPVSEPTFQTRLKRWDQALDEIDQYPLGHGLGSAGATALRSTEIQSTVAGRFDSSYLKIAYEQGFVVMVLFVLSLLVLLGGLAMRSISTTDPTAAMLGIAGCGALVAMMTQFFAGFYSDSIQTLSGWIVVGLGVAQFTADRREVAPEPDAAEPEQVPRAREPIPARPWPHPT
jgi:hypothetical protein